MIIYIIKIKLSDKQRSIGPGSATFVLFRCSFYYVLFFNWHLLHKNYHQTTKVLLKYPLALKIYEIFFVDIKMFFSPNWWQYLYVKNENIAAAMLDNIVNPTITSTVGILFCIFQWTRWYPALNCKNIFFINFIYIYFFPSFSVHRL